MQNSLFDEDGDGTAPCPISPESANQAPAVRKAGAKVGAAVSDPALIALARALPPALRLGTSTWSYPGWAGLVWDREYPEATLSRHGLAAYARHPLLRAVSIDRTFYQPLDAMRLLQYAAQVPEGFRFTVKAPAMITDAMLRDDEGRSLRPNPYFLDAAHASRIFIEPLQQGLSTKLGAAVFQLSPLPAYWLETRMPQLIERLHAFLRAMPALRDTSPDGVIAVEVRDRQWLTPAFEQALKDVGATYCLGLHARMPPLSEQLPVLRALWPGPLVCRWNLNPLHGAFGYEDAARKYEPYDRLQDPDLQTRHELARVINGVTNAGQNAFVTISNKAEGCAPLSVIELAKAVIPQGQGKP